MRIRIEIEPLDATRVRVRLVEGGSESTHEVTVEPKYAERLAGATVDTQLLIRKSFEFLLEHESKESILSRFDLSVISRYFPEFEREIRKRMQ